MTLRLPVVFLAALAGSLAVHAAALFGVDLDLPGPSAPPPLRAELRPLPPAPAAVPLPAVPRPVRPAKPRPVAVLAEAAGEPLSEPVVAGETAGMAVADAGPVAPPSAPAPAQPLLPANGVIRYAVFKVSLNLQVGQVEQRWEFADDGSYRLLGITETTGLAALLKPVRIEQESRGRMVAGGLQPLQFTTVKNGRDTNENADFDWSTATVRLSRDGSVQAVAAGTQDALSLNYQLAYLGRLSEGATLGVVTGKKYDRYDLDSLGEEELDLPAGRFRTLHLRVQNDSVTEIWIALDQRGLPVKIRFTDKKGDSFEQVATEIGLR